MITPRRRQADASRGALSAHAAAIALACALATAAPAAAWEPAPGVSVGAGATLDSFAGLEGADASGRALHTLGAFTLGLSCDLGAAGLWSDGLLYASVQQGRGRGLSAGALGNLQAVSSLEGPEFTHVGELWLEQFLLAGRVRLKLGRQDANADFCSPGYGSSFVNCAFAITPNVPITTYPEPGLGAALFAHALSWLEVGAGVYDGAPAGAGFDSAFDGAGGGFQVLEMRAARGGTGGDSGSYRLGVWRHTEDLREITDVADHWIYTQNHGLYAAVDRPLWRDPGSSDGRGVGMFLQYGWAPGDRNEIRHFAGGGLLWQSPARARSLDSVGLGVASAHLCRQLGRLEGRTRETVVEAFYRAQVRPWLALQPDAQLIVRPAGADGASAVAVGVRADIEL